MRRSNGPLVRICWLALLAVTPSLLPAAENSKPLLNSLFTNDMVLQRGIEDPIWGWTEPGTNVIVSFNGKTASATAGADGKWMAKIGPFEAGGPYELTVVAGAKSEKLANVLIGDVWLCSGQSNMSMGIGVSKNAAEEIAQADHPQLRLFTVPNITANEPRADIEPRPQWSVCTRKTVSEGGWGGFSAAAYYFGRDLQKELNVPIGLIHSSWGGTICEAWTSAEALDKNMPDFRPALEQQKARANQKMSLADAMAAWYGKVDPGTPAGWEKASAADADWKTMKLPIYWEQANVGMENYDGVVWFRREVSIPEKWAGKDLILHLGPVDDIDTTWVNGTRVGGLNVYNVPRDYPVPASAIQGGKALIAVRVLDTGGNGGIWGNAADMRLELPGSGEPPVDISGDWKYKASAPLNAANPVPVVQDNNPNVVTVLYNGMINPLIPFGIKGAIWYQGESNAGRGMQYRRLLPTMIRDWRSRFGVGDFPFFIVQLANFQGHQPQPGESAWAELREAQSITADTVGGSAIASAIDIGDASDIHPKNKQEVGRRLALDALATVYGKQIEHSGPQYKSMEKKGDAIVLTFSHADGLTAKDGALKAFAICGADHHFVWADAKIEGQTVSVSAAGVKDPVAVRYDWADNPDGNLYNSANLPATPFRTDSPQ